MKLVLSVFGALSFGLAAKAMSLTFDVSPATCGQPTSGFISAYVSGGTPPFTFLWSTGSTNSSITSLGAGTYSVTVTDALGEQATGSATVELANADVGVFGIPACPEGYFKMIGSAWDVAPGGCTFTDGNFVGGTLEGSNSAYTAFYLTGNLPAPGTMLSLAFTDASGCHGTVTGSVPYPPQAPVPQVLSIDGACSGGNNGKVRLLIPASANNWPYDLHFVNSSGLGGPLVSTTFGETPKNYEAISLSAGTWGMVLKYQPYGAYAWLSEEVWNTDPCLDTTWFTVPDLGYTCGTVSGTVFMDDDQNCTGPDPRHLPQQLMQISPGGYYTMTNQQGYYQTNLPYGSYTIEHLSSEFQEHCTGGPQPFDITAAAPAALRNFADTALTPKDVAIYASQGAVRPGFQTTIALAARNLNWGGTGTVTVSLVFDPLLQYTGAQPAPANVTGNTITWTFGQLYSFQYRDLKATFQVPPDAGLIGTVITNSATIGIVQPENDLANNSFSFQRTITGAYDPNDKVAYTSTGGTEVWLLDQDEWVDYTIRFQNTGTDTAFNVTITDTLPANLNPGAIEMGASSHASTWELRDQGTLKIYFTNIQLPDSNVNEPASHGFVSFRIKPREPLVPGTTIQNTANIFFDFNEPVITAPSVLTAEIGTGITAHAGHSMRLAPNPVSDVLLAMDVDDAQGVTEVLAADGRKVPVPVVRTGSTLRIDVHALAPGLYVLRTGMGTARFVKQ